MDPQVPYEVLKDGAPLDDIQAEPSRDECVSDYSSTCTVGDRGRMQVVLTFVVL